MGNRVVWFDMPVRDLQRATTFYAAVLDAEISEEFPGVAVMAHSGDEVSGCLYESKDHPPSQDGVLIYFNVSGRLDAAVGAAEEHGGRIEQAPHDIGSFGRRALVVDSEGNRIALHSE